MQTGNHSLRWKVDTEKNEFEVSQNSILYVPCYKAFTLLELRGHDGPNSLLWNKQ